MAWLSTEQIAIDTKPSGLLGTRTPPAIIIPGYFSWQASEIQQIQKISGGSCAKFAEFGMRDF